MDHVKDNLNCIIGNPYWVSVRESKIQLAFGQKKSYNEFKVKFET